MDELRIDFRALEAGETTLRRTVDEIDAHLNELERSVNQLLDVWSGEAADAYRAAQAEWDRAVAGMRENLAELHGLIVTAHRNHADAVRSNTSRWQM